MKKVYILFISILTILINGCSIIYTSEDISEQPEDEQPEINEPSKIIDENAFFYPSNLTINDSKIKEYSYIDTNLANEYTIYSAYYSVEYDTIYISYDFANSPKKQTLKAKDLYEIEKHAINYFVSDKNRSEDKEYLKAVRIYPDKLSSSCRRGLDDATALNINGCADYGGKEAIIDLNSITSLEEFYTPKYSNLEPMRDTFAHEYGHISTFYHMIYKGDENYEDYLKLRLGNYYNIVYPHGLPEVYSGSSSYSIQPEEILADDFVELFYNTSNKLPSDTYDYTLQYDDYRHSLEDTNVHFLKNNMNLCNQLINYYSKFLNYTNRTQYEKPIVISSPIQTINYYESLSHIGNESLVKSINSLTEVNLIAVGEIYVGTSKYYRVILSSTYECPLITSGNRYCDKKDVGEKMGYVLSNNFDQKTSIKLYKIDKNGNIPLSKTNIVPIQNDSHIIPFYDSAYVLNTTNNNNYATMYDYLNPNFSSTQTYKVNIASFATLIQ